METIKINKETLQKAINEGVYDALNAPQRKSAGEEQFDDIMSTIHYIGETYKNIGEHLTENILPELIEVKNACLGVVQRVFGNGANIQNANARFSNNEVSIEIPVVSLDGYKEFLLRDRHSLNDALEEFFRDKYGYEDDLTQENYEQVKQEFFNDEEWLKSSVDNVLDNEEDGLGHRYITPNIMYYQRSNKINISLEFPYNVERYGDFVNKEGEFEEER